MENKTKSWIPSITFAAISRKLLHVLIKEHYLVELTKKLMTYLKKCVERSYLVSKTSQLLGKLLSKKRTRHWDNKQQSQAQSNQCKILSDDVPMS